MARPRMVVEITVEPLSSPVIGFVGSFRVMMLITPPWPDPPPRRLPLVDPIRSILATAAG